MPSAARKPKKLSSTCSRVRGAMRAFVNSHCSSRARARSKPSFTEADTLRATRLARSESCMCSRTSKWRPRSCSAQSVTRSEAGALVHGDKLHAVDETHETRFGLPDDPGQLCRRPGML